MSKKDDSEFATREEKLSAPARMFNLPHGVVIRTERDGIARWSDPIGKLPSMVTAEEQERHNELTRASALQRYNNDWSGLIELGRVSKDVGPYDPEWRTIRIKYPSEKE